MSYTNIGLVDYAAAWLGRTTRYGWGCWGQPISASIIQQKAGQYPSHYDWNRQYALQGLIGKGWLIDCVGLIKGYYWGQTPGGSSVEYELSSDVDANGMYSRASVKGPISSMPETIGLCVQMDGHIGVYAGKGNVIECTRGYFGDGVVATRLSARPWLHWLECPYINYIIKEETQMATPTGDNPSDWAKVHTGWAKAKGYINGDGQGNYDWQGVLTREAMAAILHEFAISKGLDK